MDKMLFKDFKVIELASVLAGPSVGFFFAELGAQVIKVENKKSKGDVTRTWKLPSEDKKHPYSAYYASVNWGKKSLFLDLSDADDFKLIQSELKNADLVISNFKPGDAKKFHLEMEDLIALNPSLIYGEIVGYKNEIRSAYDMVLQAEAGLLSINGSKEQELFKLPLAFIDQFAGHQLKEGILLALLQQQKKTGAFHVKVSLFESALACLSNQANNWLFAQEIPKALGALHPNIAPYGEQYTCKDGKRVVLAIGNDRQFRRLCEILRINDIIPVHLFDSNQNRVNERETLNEFLKSAIEKQEQNEFLERCHQLDVPIGAIRNIKEVFELPESREMIISEEKEGHQLTAVSGNAFNLQYFPL